MSETPNKWWRLGNRAYGWWHFKAQSEDAAYEVYRLVDRQCAHVITINKSPYRPSNGWNKFSLSNDPEKFYTPLTNESAIRYAVDLFSSVSLVNLTEVKFKKKEEKPKMATTWVRLSTDDTDSEDNGLPSVWVQTDNPEAVRQRTNGVSDYGIQKQDNVPAPTGTLWSFRHNNRALKDIVYVCDRIDAWRIFAQHADEIRDLKPFNIDGKTKKTKAKKALDRVAKAALNGSRRAVVENYLNMVQPAVVAMLTDGAPESFRTGMAEFMGTPKGKALISLAHTLLLDVVPERFMPGDLKKALGEELDAKVFEAATSEVFRHMGAPIAYLLAQREALGLPAPAGNPTNIGVKIVDDVPAK